MTLKPSKSMYSSHWGTYYEGRERPPKKHPMLRDLILAAVIGAYMGVSLGVWIAKGELSGWTLGAGGTALVLHWLVIGIGQLFATTRLAGSEVIRIAAALAASTAVFTPIAWILAS